MKLVFFKCPNIRSQKPSFYVTQSVCAWAFLYFFFFCYINHCQWFFNGNICAFGSRNVFDHTHTHSHTHSHTNFGRKPSAGYKFQCQDDISLRSDTALGRSTIYNGEGIRRIPTITNSHHFCKNRYSRKKKSI